MEILKVVLRQRVGVKKEGDAEDACYEIYLAEKVSRRIITHKISRRENLRHSHGSDSPSI